jgi:hypothetical protein
MSVDIKTVEEFIKWFYKKRPNCIMCNEKLPSYFSMYLHNSGLMLGNIKMWVYVTCANANCNYQNSFVKLLNEYKV